VAASQALRVFVCNLMTQANESLGMTAADHVRALYRHAGAPVFDVALLNRAAVSPRLRAKYARQGAEPIAVQEHGMEKLGLRVVSGDFLQEEGGVARHDSAAVARALLRLGTSRRQRDTQPAEAAPALAAAASEARRVH